LLTCYSEFFAKILARISETGKYCILVDTRLLVVSEKRKSSLWQEFINQGVFISGKMVEYEY
jgi:hypothetical protein